MKPQNLFCFNPVETLKIPPLEEIVYDYIREISRTWNPEDALLEFKNLLICHENAKNSTISQFLSQIILANREDRFREILKRSCYILLNQWDANKQYNFIQRLVELFQETLLSPQVFSLSPLLRRYGRWMGSFVDSQDYKDLTLLAASYKIQNLGNQTSATEQSDNWSDRYIAYQLVPLYVNPSNPIEQRELARIVSKRLKDRFKFALALYISRCQSADYDDKMFPNPTIFGKEVLRLIKLLVARPKDITYQKLAFLFLQQIQNLPSKSFSDSLQKYLVCFWKQKKLATLVQNKLSKKLDFFHRSKKQDPIDKALLFRTCNQMVEMLTTENHREPSSIFSLMMSHSHPLTLAIALLKLSLISPPSRTHLELCLAHLIRYYEPIPEEDCSDAIAFFDFLNIILTIYGDNVEYSLVKVRPETAKSHRVFDLDAYKVFARRTSLLGAQFSRSRNCNFQDTDIKAV